jgi:enoyl-CoA hydratase/carnithine racemase
MAYEQITVAVDGSIATVTLHRPDKLNAWTPVMGAELLDAFRNIDRDPAIRVAC